MVKPHHTFLLGSACMLAAFGIASCSVDDLGKTLQVTAVPDSPQSVLGGAKIGANPIIIYRGKQTLKYAWTLTLPSGGEALIEGQDTRNANFTFNQLGTYTANLRVYESTGSAISEVSSGNYVVGAFAPLTADAVSPPITGTPSTTTGKISGTSVLEITASGGKAPYSYSWTTPSNGGVLSSTSSSKPTLSVTATPGTTVTTDCTISDSQIPAASVKISISVSVSASG